MMAQRSREGRKFSWTRLRRFSRAETTVLSHRLWFWIVSCGTEEGRVDVRVRR